MANFDRHSEEFSASRVINIVKTESADNYTVYVIKIVLGHVEWTVKHRYSEFHELHEKLVSDYKLDRHLLPPKKYFGKLSEGFIKKRQKQLEGYLQTVLRNFVSIPACLAAFLDFHKYEIHGIAQELAVDLFHNGDRVLEAAETYHTTPLQLHSLCTRLKLAQPTCDSGDLTKDIGHILDFFTQLQFLRIDGSIDLIGTSNLVQNQLEFHLQNFKSLEKLKLVSCNPSRISGVDNIKKTIKKLQVFNSVKALKDILLLDMGFGQWLGTAEESVLVPAWHQVHTAVFKSNDISYIDESVKLLPHVRELDLSHNKLHEIQELQHLPHLTSVNLSYNTLRHLQALHTKFGNVKSLMLAGNSIQSLQGFSKLYSLESLDVSSNDISELTEVEHVSNLPCLENLNLSNNPVITVVDYRNKVLAYFKDRAKELMLDGQRPTQKELDTVAVLLAIQKSRQTKERKKQTAREASITDTSFPATGSQPVAATASHLSDSDEVTEVAEVAEESLCDTGEGYREEVERLRAQGGTAWLALLSEMQQSDDVQDPVGSHQAGRAHRYKYHYDQKNKPGSGNQDTDSSSTDDSSVEEHCEPASHSQSYTEASFMLPESMPSKNDSTFVSHLQVMTPNTHALGRRSRVASDHPHREERPVHLMWAPAVRYTNPAREFPSCVYITTENIHIFEVKALTSDFEVPDMNHLYCIPLMNVQQIALGYLSLTIRVEEAFVGPHGTFTFLTGNSGKTDLFLDSLKLAYRRAVSDLDQYEDPHVVVNGDTENSLRRVLADVEHVKEDAIEVVLYMLVNVCLKPTKGKKSFTSHILVVTSRCLYILREDFIFWPQPTFAIGPSSQPQFQVLVMYPIESKISHFQMYDSDTCSPEQNQSLASTFSATNTSAMLTPNFIGYGTRLIFDLGSGITKELDIRVSTPNIRNKFLEALTTTRAKIGERSPHKMKSRSSDKESESAGSSSDKGSSSSSKRKHKSKHSKGVNKTQLAADSRGSGVSEGVNCGVRPKLQKQPNLMRVNEHYSDTEGVADKLQAFVNVSTELENLPSNNSSSPNDLPLYRESPTGESNNTVESMENTTVHPMPLPKDELLGYTGSSSYDTDMSDHLNTEARVITPPSHLPLGYPSVELLGHLTRCNELVSILQPLSDTLYNISVMTGEEIMNLFHSKLAQIGNDNEELQHLQWVEVVPYVNPRQTIVTCMMLSTKAIYFVSQEVPKPAVVREPWRKHTRYRSDTAQMVFKKTETIRIEQNLHNMSGIVHKTGDSSKSLKVYCVLALKDLQNVHIGLFDHSFRLTGNCPEQVLSCVTRDAVMSETFVRQLMSVLSLLPSPSPAAPDLGGSGSEQDFYRMFRDHHYSRSESLEYVHPSRVRFIYPNDEVIADVRFLIRENITGKKPRDIDLNILSYVLCYKQKKVSTSVISSLSLDVKKCDPRTVVLSENHLTLISEDYVSYPLPEFAKQPPSHRQHVILEVRHLEHLKRIVVSDFTSQDLTLIFADETDEVSVNVALEYYTPQSGRVDKKGMESPEVAWILLIQNRKDKERFINLVSSQWEEVHGEKLSVQVSA